MPRSSNSKVEKEDDGFLVHVFQLAQMRDATMEKMRVDQQRLVQLGNLLNASIETKYAWPSDSAERRTAALALVGGLARVGTLSSYPSSYARKSCTCAGNSEKSVTCG